MEHHEIGKFMIAILGNHANDQSVSNQEEQPETFLLNTDLVGLMLDLLKTIGFSSPISFSHESSESEAIAHGNEGKAKDKTTVAEL